MAIHMMRCKYGEKCKEPKCQHKILHTINAGCQHPCHYSLGELTCVWTNKTFKETIKLYIKNIYRELRAKITKEDTTNYEDY